MYGEFVRRERKVPIVVPLENDGSIRSMTQDATPSKVASVLRSWDIRVIQQVVHPREEEERMTEL